MLKSSTHYVGFEVQHRLSAAFEGATSRHQGDYLSIRFHYFIADDVHVVVELTAVLHAIGCSTLRLVCVFLANDVKPSFL